ncbi:hypothetical protein [Emticicia sp. 21SJ11W-3]|uniref:hypothetical protein n=1 Tax=Emticicia sp. 21SJ11W-3 TaxID=2916755 RepID=UPI0020A0D6F8|nr:hypothetical protein [Emticicia sp. 21SJ11W-3]UTA66457.1 hypothetical protein MB380_12695 [Emticicia sp. 21SJ11W-3]
MNQIVNNIFIKTYKFNSSREASTFLNNQVTDKILYLNGTYGDYYYCSVGYHSLTREKKFVLAFDSDFREDNLNLLFWDNSLVLDTGRSIYFIDENLNVKAQIEFSGLLNGLYLINVEKLLVLGEIFLTVINYDGVVVMDESFDRIEHFNIKDNVLSIQTSEENKVFQLT